MNVPLIDPAVQASSTAGEATGLAAAAKPSGAAGMFALLLEHIRAGFLSAPTSEGLEPAEAGAAPAQEDGVASSSEDAVPQTANVVLGVQVATVAPTTGSATSTVTPGAETLPVPLPNTEVVAPPPDEAMVPLGDDDGEEPVVVTTTPTRAAKAAPINPDKSPPGHAIANPAPPGLLRIRDGEPPPGHARDPGQPLVVAEGDEVQGETLRSLVAQAVSAGRRFTAPARPGELQPPTGLAQAIQPGTELVNATLASGVLGVEGAQPTAPAEQAAAPARDVEMVVAGRPTIKTVTEFAVRSVRYLSSGEEKSLSVRLVPRSLGELQIAVKSVGDSIEVTLTAASAMVREVLESQVTGIRDALSRDGVDVGKVTVQTAPTLDSNGGQGFARHMQQHGQEVRQAQTRLPHQQAWEADMSGPQRPAQVHSGALNLIV